RVQDALRRDARARGGDEGDLDAVEAGVSRYVRRLPADDDLAEARAEAPPAGARGGRFSIRRAPRDRLRRRLGAARAAPRLWRRARAAAGRSQAGGGGRTR